MISVSVPAFLLLFYFWVVVNSYHAKLIACLRHKTTVHRLVTKALIRPFSEEDERRRSSALQARPIPALVPKEVHMANNVNHVVVQNHTPPQQRQTQPNQPSLLQRQRLLQLQQRRASLPQNIELFTTKRHSFPKVAHSPPKQRGSAPKPVPLADPSSPPSPKSTPPRPPKYHPPLATVEESPPPREGDEKDISDPTVPLLKVTEADEDLPAVKNSSPKPFMPFDLRGEKSSVPEQEAKRGSNFPFADSDETDII